LYWLRLFGKFQGLRGRSGSASAAAFALFFTSSRAPSVSARLWLTGRLRCPHGPFPERLSVIQFGFLTCFFIIRPSYRIFYANALTTSAQRRTLGMRRLLPHPPSSANNVRTSSPPPGLLGAQLTPRRSPHPHLRHDQHRSRAGPSFSSKSRVPRCPARFPPALPAICNRLGLPRLLQLQRRHAAQSNKRPSAPPVPCRAVSRLPRETSPDAPTPLRVPAGSSTLRRRERHHGRDQLANVATVSKLLSAPSVVPPNGRKRIQWVFHYVNVK